MLNRFLTSLNKKDDDESSHHQQNLSFVTEDMASFKNDDEQI